MGVVKGLAVVSWSRKFSWSWWLLEVVSWSSKLSWSWWLLEVEGLILAFSSLEDLAVAMFTTLGIVD